MMMMIMMIITIAILYGIEFVLFSPDNEYRYIFLHVVLYIVEPQHG